MSRLVIDGLKRLHGETEVHGSKNSTLPILAAALLCEGKSLIHNCPDLSDVAGSINILRYLGCEVEFSDKTLLCCADDLDKNHIPDSLMREMRSSIIFLGALLAKTGSASMCFPGGCDIGLRPIDLHLKALSELGAEISDDHGIFRCTSPNGLHGANISLSFPSVGATENVMICASVAQGTTVITNAAREPEICDLADFLNSCGANITGAGEGTIIIDGVNRLQGTRHSVIPDRIVASTLLAGCAATGGKIRLDHVIPSHLGAVLSIFSECGCDVDIRGSSIIMDAPERLTAPKIVRTMPYPGFPTDAQAPIMAMIAKSRGTTLFVENIFENRYLHVNGLLRMGANIKVEGKVAVLQGVDCLHGADVEARDLRGAAALIVAALGAEGKTTLSGLKYLDRGYEDIESTLRSLGGDVRRI
ncbi:MAG: UDP-N-acetylglucosamine 1-carboxyvinyltransferase [Acutalibacteraceae bacterium]|nr:UDP-N-acetylglucosamine 1-carboxyvinyltransferase [Acutalibacteraceae bacterium]